MTLDPRAFPPASHLSEPLLGRGYGLMDIRPCACGGTIAADPFEPATIAPAVAVHNESTIHAKWRAAREAGG